MKTKTIPAYLPVKLYERLRREAYKSNVKMAKIIRMALKAYLNKTPEGGEAR